MTAHHIAELIQYVEEGRGDGLRTRLFWASHEIAGLLSSHQQRQHEAQARLLRAAKSAGLLIPEAVAVIQTACQRRTEEPDNIYYPDFPRRDC
jgi:hypothetical protein